VHPWCTFNGSYSLEQLNRKNFEVIFGNIFPDANFLEEIRLQNELSLIDRFRAYRSVVKESALGLAFSKRLGPTFQSHFCQFSVSCFEVFRVGHVVLLVSLIFERESLAKYFCST